MRSPQLFIRSERLGSRRLVTHHGESSFGSVPIGVTEHGGSSSRLLSRSEHGAPMSIAKPRYPSTDSLSRVLTTDFCPWANRFVYWLKEPVGWFVLATGISVIVGLYAAPIGWTMAASLVGLIVVGMAWPWVAVRAVVCELHPQSDRVHEGEPCGLTFRARNRLPIPLWGLAVEGFLDRQLDPEVVDTTVENVPTVALAYAGAWSVSDYRFEICPALRGRYPCGQTTLVCSFPFGIWTARKSVPKVRPITVWPKTYPIEGEVTSSGRCRRLSGDGERQGGHGDFIGIRDYRSGDAMRQVNWACTARRDRLTVTVRGGPQCPAWRVIVDDSMGEKEVVADRIRVAASVLAALHSHSMPIRLQIGKRTVPLGRGHEGFTQMMDSLTDVPTHGNPESSYQALNGYAGMEGESLVTVSSGGTEDQVHVAISTHQAHRRAGNEHWFRRVDRGGDLGAQILALWSPEGADERVA